MFSSLRWQVLLCGVVSLVFGSNSTKSILGPYKISGITVSGISSGGYMANQMHVAYSEIIDGAAVFAGGPFYCAESTIAYAEHKCMDNSLGTPQTLKLIDLTISDAMLGYIDPTSNMRNDRVYLFSGKADSVISQKVVQELQSYYEAFVEPSNIVADYGVSAEHCMPTLNYGESCETLSAPYLGKCQFDGAGKALEALYGTLKPRTTAITSNLHSFSQTPYIPAPMSSLDDTGYIYIPTSCSNGVNTCSLHISFHGCFQTMDDIGIQYAEHAGYNEWAESNNIIVLYPFVKKSNAFPLNPNGCWDWWAYTNVFYGVKIGVQMTFVRNLIEAITGK